MEILKLFRYTNKVRHFIGIEAKSNLYTTPTILTKQEAFYEKQYLLDEVDHT